MKKIFLTILLLLPFVLNAQSVFDKVRVGEFTSEKQGDRFVNDIVFDLNDLDVNFNKAVVLTPRVVNGQDTLDLPSLGIYGRVRYFYYLRNGGMITGEGETSYLDSKKPSQTVLHAEVPYEQWMHGSQLVLNCKECGCCGEVLDERDIPLSKSLNLVPYKPNVIFVTPVEAAQKRIRTLKASAFVDFVVDKYDIDPFYRNNASELAKIRASIDSVRSDKDVRILNVALKGYASPESPYEHNAFLAEERTKAIRNYLILLYGFDVELFTINFEPEDWEGLRSFVEASSELENKDAILRVIDGTRKPDDKEWIIKTKYKKDYAYLHKNCYPALRRTEYAIEYEVTSYAPDLTANINAANSAIERGDYVSAAKYLDKAGNSPEAVYARGVLCFLKGDYEGAEPLFEEALARGITQAEEVLIYIKGLSSF